jgi:hypothetical protein
LDITTVIANRICLPAGITLTELYGAERTILLLGEEPGAATVRDYLLATLPGLGWTITAQSDTGIMFYSGEWEGAFAAGDGTWGLTVRSE